MNTRIPKPWQLTGGLYPLARVFIRRLLLVAVLCCLVWPAMGASQERKWIGPLNGLWSHPDNWDPQGVPQNGDELWFSSGFTTLMVMVNDLTDLTVDSLNFDVGLLIVGDASVHLSGNTLGITGGIFNTINRECQVFIECGLKLADRASIATGRMNDVNFDYITHQDAALHLKGPIDLNGHTLFLTANAAGGCEGRLYVEGGISGSGDVYAYAKTRILMDTFNAWGVVEFREMGNDFSGKLVLDTMRDGAEILLNVSSGVVVNDHLIVDGLGTVKFGRPNQIGDAATVRIQDGAMFHMEGHDDTILNLELANDEYDISPSVLDTGGGTLTVEGNVTSTSDISTQTPAIKGKLHLPGGPHTFDISGTVYAGLDLQAQISGGGGFSKFGDAALLLRGNNTFEGSVNVASDTIDVYHANGLGSTRRGVTLSGGGVTLHDLYIHDETLFVRGDGQITAHTRGSLLACNGEGGWLGRVELDTNLVVNSTDLCLLGGPIVGVGGLELLGSRTQLVDASMGPDPYTFTGLTRVLCQELIVTADDPFNGPVIVGGGFSPSHEMRWENNFNNGLPQMTVFANGLANLNGRNNTFDQLVLQGGRVSTAEGRLYVGGVTALPANLTAWIEGNLSPSVGLLSFNVSDGTATPDLAVTAAFSDLANVSGIRKLGLGEMVFSAANAYDGPTTVEAGLLQIQNDTSLGTTAAGTTVADGATLQIEVAENMAEPLHISGYGRNGSLGALNLFPIAGVSGDIVLSAASSVRVDSSYAILAGTVSGTGPFTKVGAGTLQLGGSSGGNNTYTGDTLAHDGMLVLFKPQFTQAVPGNLIIGTGAFNAPATVRLFNHDQIGGHVTVNRGGLLDLYGFDEYSGDLTLNDGGDIQTDRTGVPGTLVLGAGATVYVNPGNNGASSISGHVRVSEGCTFSVGLRRQPLFNPAPELDLRARLSDALDTYFIYKAGAGNMRLSGANSFAANFGVLAGLATVANNTGLGRTSEERNRFATYIFDGGALALDGGVTVDTEQLYLDSNNALALQSLAGSNIWNGRITLLRDTTVAVIPPNGFLQILNVIAGSGGITKVGAGMLNIGGAADNTYSGDTVVNEGALTLSKIYGFEAVPANLVVGQPNGGLPATAVYLSHDQVFQNITVNANGLLDLNGFDEYAGSLTLQGGGDVQTGTGALYVLSGGITVHPGDNTISTISGRLGFDAGKQTIHVGAGATVGGVHELVISAEIFEANSPASLEKSGPGSLHLTGANAHAGTNHVRAGKLQVDGFQPQSRVDINGGTLLGTGTVGPVMFSGASGRIAPGASAGVLTSGSLNAGTPGTGTLTVELNGITPGIQYDQLQVQGTVNLTGLTLQPSVNFTPSAGSTFTIINNDGADTVAGTFSGLAQGAALIADGERFSISYTGGDGNDVVLTHQSSVPQMQLTTLPARKAPNYAVDFDGVDDRVEAATDLFTDLADTFTIELWANPTAMRGETAEEIEGISGIGLQRFAVFPDQGDQTYGGLLGPGHAGAGLSIGRNGVSVYEHAGDYLPSRLVFSSDLSGWTHVAMVYSDKAPSLYINGFLVRTGLASTKAHVHASANLGGSTQGFGYGNYQGQLDEVRIWNSALSPTQIQDNMNRTLAGTEPGLVAYYRCDDNDGTVVEDSAPLSPNEGGILANGAVFVLSGAQSPEAIYGSTVTLSGLANPKGLAGTVWFEWGATTSYGNVTAAQAVAAGIGNTSFSHQLTELAAGSYHFRAAGSNNLHVSYGLDQSFILIDETPRLRIEALPGGQVRLLWPAKGPLFRLESTPHLNPAVWSWVQLPATVVGTDHVVTHSPGSSAQFYRLVNP